MQEQSQAYQQLKQELKRRISDFFSRNPGNDNSGKINRANIEKQLCAMLAPLSGKPEKPTLSKEEEVRLIEEIAGDLVGAGPLEPLVSDPEVTEVMVNGVDQVYVERDGRLERTDVRFDDTNQLMHTIERMLDTAGLSVSEAEPFIDASLPNGQRINVVIPPLAVDGPSLTIRKKFKRLTMDDLIRLGTLSPKAASFLEMCLKAKVNMVVSGGTSSGKTTLVEILTSYLPKDERVVTIENVSELDLGGHEHRVRMVAKPPNPEGKGEIPLRALVRNALRMRPDRIILGEARGGEALDVIQAMQTGHDGVLTVLHANSAAGALERLETLMLMSGLEVSVDFCRRQIASAVELIVHLSHLPDGSRNVEKIVQVVGCHSDGFDLEELFEYRIDGATQGNKIMGRLVPTGKRPRFQRKFAKHNIQLPEDMFADA